MTKIKKVFICQNCGTTYPKWQGQCLNCKKWDTLKEEIVTKTKNNKITFESAEIVKFKQVEIKKFKRLKTGIGELDRVLGGGIVLGSLILLGGEPGIGKSTLVLEIAEKISHYDKVLYVSGEESAQQIKLRAQRLKIKTDNILYLGERNLEVISSTIEQLKPILVIIDSIQTVYLNELPSEAGSLSQVKGATSYLMSLAKKMSIPIFIIGHVTKEGIVAGPKTLEHLVDTVLYLEGDKFHYFRLLKATKNRFGSTNEVGVFEMREEGLIEVKDPSSIFLTNLTQDISGISKGVIVEGSRAFLVEIQALLSKTNFGYPQRRSIGFDINRLSLILAVLSKRTGLALANYDVYLNIVGGIKVEEPAIDLAVASAIISAFKNKPINSKYLFIGEVGLGGEIRPVSFIEKRIQEADKVGMKRIYLPETKLKLPKTNLEIIKVKNLREII